MELLRTGFAAPGAALRLAGLAPATLAEVERLRAAPAGRAPRRRGPRAADSPAARVRLLEAIGTVLAAIVHGRVPGIVAVEDLHWADDASREAIQYLARRLAGRSMLLLLTWRPGDLEGGTEAFADAVQGLPGVVSVRLERLDDVVVGALVDAASASGLPAWDPAALAAESEGLPLYVVEALMAGPGAAGHAPPRGVLALLRERLASVSETAGQVLAAAAVIGRSFDFATVRAASGRSDEETVTSLEELVRRGIVRELVSSREPAFDFGAREAAGRGVRGHRCWPAAGSSTGGSRRCCVPTRQGAMIRGGLR